MRFPSIIDYDKAIRNFGNNVRSQQFQGGTPETNGFDLVAYTGGYSRVYLIKLGEGFVGLRCWLGEVDGQQSRYFTAYEFFGENKSPYLAQFEYIESGILIDDKVWWPILYIEWVDGLRLNKFLDAHIGEPQIIAELSVAFLEMIKHLHHLGVSHGDLQDGNILVQKTDTELMLRLIDYDTIYVPTMDSSSVFTVGVPEYQHPKRKLLSANPKCIDYFSELVIYLSLRAYVEKPEWWKIGQNQQLLFSSEDLEYPESSSVFNDLNNLSDEISYLARALRAYCKEDDWSKILPVDKLLSKRKFDLISKELDQYFQNFS